MDRKAAKRRTEREAVRNANKRIRGAELLLELHGRRRSREMRAYDIEAAENENDGNGRERRCADNIEAAGNESDENGEEGRIVEEQEAEAGGVNDHFNNQEDRDSVVESDHEDVGSEDDEAGPQAILDHDEYVRQQLLEWILSGGVSMAKVDDLLKRLKPVHPNLPLSYKTLLKTPRSVAVSDCGNGSLWYYGIKPQLHRNLSREYLMHSNEIVTDINIDSVPLFNKSSTNFVPILGKLVGRDHPFIIGIFCGCGSDPKDMDKFFEFYVDEVNDLKSNGFIFEEKRYNFRTRHYILDQKARASVKCVKGVRGYFCCEKCVVKGIDYMNRMCLLDHECELRTDESFIDLASAVMKPKSQHYDDEDVDSHVNGVSPLLGCETKLVSKFRLDSMHLVYKGTFLRWLEFLWSGHGTYSFSVREKQDISSQLGSFRKWCPCDFNRKPFAIKSEKMKATELRRILLYDGLACFRKLDKNIFKNFLLLHTAIYILCSPIFFKDLNEEAEKFLRAFVTHCESLFGPEFIVYNVHSMVHLASECFEHGPLDTFGAFPFENYLGMIKSRVTSKTKPLQQIAKREMEKINKPREDARPEQPMLQMPCVNDIHEQVAGQQYTKILLRSSVLSVKLADSFCALHNGAVVRISNIISSENGPLLVVQKFAETCDYYKYPISSSLLGILKVSGLEARSLYVTPDDVKHKCYLIPLEKDNYVCVPILHSV